MDNEQQAIAFGNKWANVKRRLLEAKACLKRDFAQLFAGATFDEEKKALISACRRFGLHWAIRRHPDKPVDYLNQQTLCGVVLCLEYEKPQPVDVYTEH